MRLHLLFVPLFLFTACKKDDPVHDQPVKNMLVRFRPVLNGVTFRFNQDTMDNPFAERFTVSKLNYYVTNIVLRSGNAIEFREKESYHLVRHFAGEDTLTIRGIPEGTYDSIEFILGVDSVRNVSGVQSGALDPARDMFWDWETGYIYFKLEGEYSLFGQDVFQPYGIHVGGFKQPFSCIQQVQLQLKQPVKVTYNSNNRVTINTEIKEVFKNPKDISFDYYYQNIGDKTFQDVSINYRDMFSVSSVDN